MTIQKCIRCGGQLIGDSCLQCGYSPGQPEVKMNPSAKGRPEKLNDTLKKWVVSHQEGRKKKSKATAIRVDMRIFLEKEFRQEIKVSGLNWSEKQIQDKVDEMLPGLSAIQKYLKPVNKRLDTPLPLDTLWHLGTLSAYPLPPEGIAKVFEIKCLFGRPPKRQKGAWGISLSIREAIWISRLSLLKFKLITDRQLQQLVDFSQDDDPAARERRHIAIQLLNSLQLVDFSQDDDPAARERRHIAVQQMVFAINYATAERISELSGIPFDSYDRDEQIYNVLGYPKPKRMEAEA